VCRKEVHGGSEQDDIADLCTECGENPAVPGGELCLSCLKEMARRLSPSATEDDLVPDAALEIDSVSTMDEIVIDIDAKNSRRRVPGRRRRRCGRRRRFHSR
jgi:hypothetical protein